MVVIADDSKRVAHLGRFPLPVEIVRFGWTATRRLVRELLASMDVDGHQADVRMGKDGPLVTDEGNYILDLHLGRDRRRAGARHRAQHAAGGGRARALHRHGALRGARPPRRHGRGALPARRARGRPRGHRRAHAQPGRVRRCRARASTSTSSSSAAARAACAPRASPPSTAPASALAEEYRYRRHLRDPRLHARRSCSSMPPLSPTTSRMPPASAGRVRGAALRLADADRQQGRRDRAARGALPRPPASGPASQLCAARATLVDPHRVQARQRRAQYPPSHL